MERIIKIPSEIKAKMEGRILTVQGPQGTTSKEFKHAFAKVEVKDDKIIISSRLDSRRGKCMIGTFESHVINLIKGVTEGYEAKLKICYNHFPITLKINGNIINIENFAGEKYPRTTRIIEGCKVKVNGTEITVTGINKENVAQTASNIEQTARVRRKDLRIFQDGIWLIEKVGGKTV